MFSPPEQNVADITKRLEDNLGIPTWKGRGNPLGSLILTVLSQSTNDRNRDTAYQRLKQSFSDWEAVMNSPADKIADAIRPAGLANQKSQRIKDILKWVYETYGSFNLDCLCDMDSEQVIDTFLNLKGVGIKTISVVLMYTCGKDIFPVDTHVHRICKRLGLVPEKDECRENTSSYATSCTGRKVLFITHEFLATRPNHLQSPNTKMSAMPVDGYLPLCFRDL